MPDWEEETCLARSRRRNPYRRTRRFKPARASSGFADRAGGFQLRRTYSLDEFRETNPMVNSKLLEDVVPANEAGRPILAPGVRDL